MHCSIRPRRIASCRGLASWILSGSVSLGAIACSGDSEPSAEPEDQDLPLEGADPDAMTNTGNGAAANADATTTDSDADEGTPEVIGIDAPGSESANSDTAMTPMPSPDVPADAYCADAEEWDPEWVQFEEEVLLLVNESRSEAADCGVEGLFNPAPPLVMDPILRCSARLHSVDMFDRAYFNHDNPDGLDPFQRMAAAGFVGSGGGENIALGQTTPEQVMQAWMDSDGHCANVMRPNFTLIGVGYHPGQGRQTSNYWTQNFGAPARTGGGGGRR